MSILTRRNFLGSVAAASGLAQPSRTRDSRTTIKPSPPRPKRGDEPLATLD